MFSAPDLLVASVLALLLFGPDQLPKMMRQAGRVMREVQNTSQSFVAEMERAADLSDRPPSPEITPAVDAGAAAGGPQHVEAEIEAKPLRPPGGATGEEPG